ncbi:hypothetical protein [Coraliomargarita parva]|uniref:hypothetical protein n=1 Tax=Coraliomargarita parva TaxID=3014050 RepID=UPI0022B36EBD|nr:hypothetical protein [Coraliomargarita parva]
MTSSANRFPTHLKTWILLFSCWLGMSVSSSAAIVVRYNFSTGDYTISGSDSGPGYQAMYPNYGWNFGDSSTNWDVGYSVLNPIFSDIGNQWSAGGGAHTSFSLYGFSATMAYGDTEGGNTGTLSLLDGETEIKGTVATGLGDLEAGVYVGQPVGTYSSETFTLEVVPEPASYACIIGAVSLLLVHRRRKGA